jgi:hypothetical protein
MQRLNSDKMRSRATVGLATFFSAKAPQSGQWIQTPPRVQQGLLHTLALHLGSASTVWWSAGICSLMQITRRWKQRFDETVGRAVPYIDQLSKRRRYLYICSRSGTPIESWPKEAGRQPIKERRTADSAKAARICRLLRFPTRTSTS